MVTTSKIKTAMKTTGFFPIAVLLMAGMLMAGCNQDKDELAKSQPARKGEKVTVRANVSFRGDFAALAKAASESGQGTPIRRAMDANGHKYYVNGDQVMLVYQTTDGETLTSISDEYYSGPNSEGQDSSFYFTWEVEDPDDTKDFTLVYPATRCDSITGAIKYGDLSQQDGTLETASKLDLATFTGGWKYMYEPEAIPLSNPLTICKFTITNKDGKDLTNTATNLSFSNGTDEYVINRNAEAGPIYVMMKPVQKSTFLFFSKIGKDLYSKTVSDKTLKAGNIYPISLTMLKSEELGTLLPGVFTAGYRVWSARSAKEKSGRVRYNTHTFKCRFSRGNLQYSKRARWSFAKHQWDYVGKDGANSTPGGIPIDGIVDLFGWSSEAPGNNYGLCSSDVKDANEYRFNYSGRKGRVHWESLFKEWGENRIADGGGRNWYTLEPDGWREIIHRVGVSTVNGVKDACYAKGMVNGVPGLILFPDVYIHPAGVKGPNKINERDPDTGYQSNDYQGDDWTMMEFAGAVFLPAAGRRDVNNVICDAGVTGYYWTSISDPKKDMVTIYNRRPELAPLNIAPEQLLGAECFYFTSSNVVRYDIRRRYEGFAVRLVCEVNNKKMLHMRSASEFGYEDYVYPDDAGDRY